MPEAAERQIREGAGRPWSFHNLAVFVLLGVHPTYVPAAGTAGVRFRGPEGRRLGIDGSTGEAADRRNDMEPVHVHREMPKGPENLR